MIKNWKYPAEKVKCPDCGKVVSGVRPKGGDGTALHPRPHKADGKPCDGRHALVVL